MMLLIWKNKGDFGIYKTELFYFTKVVILCIRFGMKELAKIPSNCDPFPRDMNYIIL